MKADGAGCSPRQKWSHLLKVQECARPPAEIQEHPKATCPVDPAGLLREELPLASAPAELSPLPRPCHGGAGLLLGRLLRLLGAGLERCGCSKFCS